MLPWHDNCKFQKFKCQSTYYDALILNPVLLFIISWNMPLYSKLFVTPCVLNGKTTLITVKYLTIIGTFNFHKSYFLYSCRFKLNLPFDVALSGNPLCLWPEFDQHCWRGISDCRPTYYYFIYANADMPIIVRRYPTTGKNHNIKEKNIKLNICDK